MSAKKAVSKNEQTRSSGSDSVPCSRNWSAPPDLQRPDWEPEKPSGCVDLGYALIHGMTCEDARIIAAAPKHLEICRLQLATTVMERDHARDKIKRAANALKHHHMARPGIAEIVQLLC